MKQNELEYIRTNLQDVLECAKEIDQSDCCLRSDHQLNVERIITKAEGILNELEKPTLFQEMLKEMKSMNEVEARAVHEAFKESLKDKPDKEEVDMHNLSIIKAVKALNVIATELGCNNMELECNDNARVVIYFNGYNGG